MQKTIEVKLQEKYPGLWSLLNNKAKVNLPPGIVEYLTKKNYKRTSWQSLKIPEKYINQLITICGIKTVADTYRRDLSSVTDENAFLNFTHEIVVCSSMATLNSGIRLRPQSGKGECDFSLPIEGVTVYGEVKRWLDNYWLKDISKPKSRLIFKPVEDYVNDKIHRPRSMDLYGKLIEATRQFSEGNVNVLFLFPHSFGEELRQVQQALFGDINYFRKPDEVTLEGDGFFATQEGRSVSACYLAREDFGIFVIPGSWNNPNAIVSLPSYAKTLFKRFDINNLKSEIEKLANTM